MRKALVPFERHLFFLFDDILLETQQTKESSYKFKRVYQLNKLQIQEYEGDDFDADRMFLLSDDEVTLQVKADSQQEREEWLAELRKQKEEIQSKQARG
jgi:hypothetical protein